MLGVLLGLWGLGSAACGDDADIRDPRRTAPMASGMGDPAVAAPVARVSATDAWLDLIAQRPNAVIQRFDAVVVDLGSKAAQKHVSLGSRAAWRLGEVTGERAAGTVVGRSASVEIPLDGALSPLANPETTPGAAPPDSAGEDAEPPDPVPGIAMAIEVHPLVEDQRMTVLLNERPLANLVLGKGWTRRTFSLPQDLVRPGENQVRFFFRRLREDDGVSAAIASVVVGTHERIKNPPAGAERRDILSLQDAPDNSPTQSLSVRQPRDKGGLRVAGGTGLAYYLVPPARGRLGLEVSGTGAISVTVSTDADHAAGRPPTRLVDEPLRESGQSIRADLTGWGGTAVRLEIAVRGQGSSAVFEQARVEAPRTIPVDTRTREARDVIVVTVEGMRHDALKVGLRPELPILEDMLASSLVFEQAYAPSPAAIPSHAAWLSSVAPPRHLTVQGTFVADNQILLPEALSRGGYVRVQVTANGDLGQPRGLSQGIDSYAALSEVVDTPTAGAVIQDGLDRLADKPGRWFLHANFNDPQAPYEPVRELVRDATPPQGSPLPHLTHIWVGRVRLGKTIPSAEELKYIRRLYRGELQVVDAALGELLTRLRREKRLDDAIVVFMGVHGEEFFEHAGAGHARTLYNESLRVPLAIHAPALLAPGRVEVPVDLLDLAPTLLDLLGTPIPDRWQGRSWVPLIDDPQPPPQAVSAYFGDGSRAVVVGQHKLVLGPGRKEEYTDLTADPIESLEVPSEPGIGLRIVRSALSWELANEGGWRRARWGTGANLTSTFARDLGM